MPARYDTIVIGAGQSGPSLADRLVKAGQAVAIIERQHFGGTCVNTGCVPTKTLVASAYVAHMARRASDYGVGAGPISIDMKQVKARKDAIVEKSRGGVAAWMERRTTVYRGHARLTGPRTVVVNEERLEADRIIINTGGRVFAPPLPGLDSVPYLTNSSLLDLETVPEHLVIVGGSYIGLEFAQVFRRFGAQVSVIEMAERLIAREDQDVSEAVREILAAEGINIHLKATCLAVERDGIRQVGVMSAPAIRERWFARRGGGSWAKGSFDESPRRIRVSGVGSLGDAQLLYGSGASIERSGRAPGFLDLRHEVWRERGFGDFWGYALVAEGAAEAMIEIGVNTWDLAAPEVVVEEAGGLLTDLAGTARIDGLEVLATNGVLHEVMLARLQREAPAAS